jgi:preprotein translocase subunit SecD
MANIRSRLLLIAALVALSIWALFPRNQTITVERNGSPVEVTHRVFPLKKGLDLEGGMYLALEVDESKGTVANKSDALERALKVVRNRVEGFGVSEPVVQKVGSDRIVVELPGITDPERARNVIKESAFLQFQIVDKTNALDKAMPRIDQVLKQKGVSAAVPGVKGDTGSKNAITGLFTQGDSARKTDSAKAGEDTSALGNLAGGPFSKLLQAGQMPGQYFVAKKDVPAVETYLAMPEVQAALPPGKVVRFQNDDQSVRAEQARAL